MSMTYRDFQNEMNKLPDNDPILNQTMTIFVPGVDEYYPATFSFTDDDCDVLDPGHLVLTIN